MMSKQQWTICLTLVLLVLGVVFRPSGRNTAMTEDTFFANKLVQHNKFDMILAGDSRTTLGVAPAEMAEQLPEVKIFNFGFLGVSLSGDYLRRITSLLLQDTSETRMIVLGISPPALTPMAARANTYLEWEGKNHATVLQHAYLGEWLTYFQPYDLSLGRGVEFKQHFYADGWQATTLIPADENREVVAGKIHFANTQVSAEMIEALLNTVRVWTAQGIRVYGFRPPVSPALYNLENNISGFQEDSFRQQFAEAGGHWLHTENKYPTYDGSHLNETSARQFSQDLAADIQRDLSAASKRQ